MPVGLITLKDLPEIDAIQRLGFPVQFHEDMGRFGLILGHPDTAGFLYWNNGCIAGYAIGYPAHAYDTIFTGELEGLPEGSDWLYLHDLCVHPDMQGQGIGQALYADFESNARAMGFVGIFAIALPGRLGFWERMGFTASETILYRGERSTKISKSLCVKPVVQQPWDRSPCSSNTL